MRTPSTRWGRNLQRLIRESGVTQGDIAKKAGLDRNGISRMYSATDVKVSSLEALARVIGVDVAALFDAGVDRDLLRHEVPSRPALGERETDGTPIAPGLFALCQELRALLARLAILAAECESEARAARPTVAGRPRRRRAAR